MSVYNATDIFQKLYHFRYSKDDYRRRRKPVRPDITRKEQPVASCSTGAARIFDSTSSPGVLVAEDDPLSRKLLETLLPTLGAVPEIVLDGVTAVQRVRERSYDLVLMDLWMPLLDGAAATRAIRALPLPAAATPIIG